MDYLLKGQHCSPRMSPEVGSGPRDRGWSGAHGESLALGSGERLVLLESRGRRFKPAAAGGTSCEAGSSELTFTY